MILEVKISFVFCSAMKLEYLQNTSNLYMKYYPSVRSTFIQLKDEKDWAFAPATVGNSGLRLGGRTLCDIISTDCL